MAADPAFQQGPHRSRADQKSEQPLRRLVWTQLVRFGRDRTRDHSRAWVSTYLPCVSAMTSTSSPLCGAPWLLMQTGGKSVGEVKSGDVSVGAGCARNHKKKQ